MKSSKWPDEIPSLDEFMAFEKLLEPESITAQTSVFKFGLLADLVSPNSRREDKEKLDALWTEVTLHKVYRRLTGDPNFKRLWKTFEQKAGGKSAGKFGEPYGRFHFLRIVNSALVMFYVCQISGHPPKRPTIQVKRRALKALDALLECEKEGLRFWELTSDFGFEMKLTQLRAELELTIEQHKNPMNDDAAVPRFAAEYFTDKLMLWFGDAPRGLVNGFAAVIDYSTDAIEKHRKNWISARIEKSRKVTSNFPRLPSRTASRDN
jgi:hypothetical protein